MRHRHAGKPAPGQDFDEFLHHALHTAADQVEPHPDGLERIRARVGASRADAVSASTVSASTVPASTVSASTGLLAVWLRRWNARRGGHSAGHARRGPQRDWRVGLIRPAIALACAVFAVGVVLASVPPLRQALSSSVSSAFDGKSSTSVTNPAVSARSGQAVAGGAGAHTTAARHQRPTPLASCPQSSAAASPSTTPTTSSPAATATTSSSPSSPPPSPPTSPATGLSGSGSPNATGSASSRTTSTSSAQATAKATASGTKKRAKRKAGTICGSPTATASPSAKPKATPVTSASSSPTAPATSSSSPAGSSPSSGDSPARSSGNASPGSS